MNRATITQLIMRPMGDIHVCLYRTSKGRVGKQWLGGDVLLLTVTGRKSGRPRTLPLLHVRDGDALVVVASDAGLDSNPVWWLNLRTNPIAEVEIGGRRWRVRAEHASPEEKKRLWLKLVRTYPGYDTYQHNTRRHIPLIKLHPAM